MLFFCLSENHREEKCNYSNFQHGLVLQSILHVSAIQKRQQRIFIFYLFIFFFWLCLLMVNPSSAIQNCSRPSTFLR